MGFQALLTTAAGPAVEVVRNVKADQLNAATPCGEYDVRKLINHLLYWGPSLEGAAHKASVAPPAGGEQSVDLVDKDWAAVLEAQIDRLAAAWSEPAAWEGTTTMGGPTQMPSSIVGDMVLGELVLHGWDLARATGQDPRWDTHVVRAVHQGIAGMAEQGRQMGVYGAEVAVPDTAPELHRALGLSGRDPHWTAQG